MVLTKDDFQQKVLDSQGLTFVEFFASWCPHCQAYAPEYAQISQELANEANFYQVEIDQSKGLANEYNIEAIPTIVVFYNGQDEGYYQGAQPIQVYQEVIDQFEGDN